MILYKAYTHDIP